MSRRRMLRGKADPERSDGNGSVESIGSLDDLESGENDRLHPTTRLHRRNLDFGSVALYVPGLQVVVALVLCCATSLLVCAVLPTSALSAVRTATLSAIVAIMLVVRPVRVADCVGMDLVFDTVRPAVFAYLIAIVMEQLMHGCSSSYPPPLGSSVRRWLYNVCITVAMGAGLARAANPTSQRDYPFLVAALAFITVAMLPPVPSSAQGPLCAVNGAWDAAERLTRAALFGLAYCSLAYADGPSFYTFGEICLSATRATAASAWILGVPAIELPFSVLQIAIVVWTRITIQDRGVARTSLSTSRYDRIDGLDRLDDGDNQEFETSFAELYGMQKCDCNDTDGSVASNDAVSTLPRPLLQSEMAVPCEQPPAGHRPTNSTFGFSGLGPMLQSRMMNGGDLATDDDDDVMSDTPLIGSETSRSHRVGRLGISIVGDLSSSGASSVTSSGASGGGPQLVPVSGNGKRRPKSCGTATPSQLRMAEVARSLQ